MRKKLLPVLGILLISMLAFAAPGDNALTFAWDPSVSRTNADFAGYRFYWGLVGVSQTNVQSVGSNVTTITISNLTVGTYWAGVTARTTNLESGFSNIILVSVPAAPGNLKPVPSP